MTKKSRYFLILLGFITFLILAPLIVIFVHGLSYNSKTGKFVQTGLLAYVAEPKNSQLFLDGKLKKNSSGDVNFVPAGEYQVTVKYPGRQDWGKRLFVESGQVTWANPKDSKVYLFLSEPVSKNLAEDVDDFYNQGNSLIYLQNQTVVVSSVNNPQVAENHPLPKPVDSILAVNDSGNSFIFSKQNSTSHDIIYFNTGSGQIVDLTSLFKQRPNLKFAGDDLYALYNKDLYKVDPIKKTLKNMQSGVRAFYFQGNDLYLLQKTKSGNQLTLSRTPYASTQILIGNLPELNNPELFVSFSKQIFILDTSKLYLASSEMQLLADNVNAFNFDSQNPAVPISETGELDYFDTLGKGLMFITRSSNPILNPVVTPSIAHAFYSTQTQIFTTELDGRNNQNTNLLYSGNSIKSFTVDEDGKNIVVLDNGVLKNITVR